MSDEIRACFDKFDADGSGTISGMELIKVIRSLPNVEGDTDAANISVVSTEGDAQIGGGGVGVDE